MKTSDLSEFDLYLFHQGTNYHAYEMLGAHFVEQDGKKGVRFAVWAPHAKSVSVVGDFNSWDTRVDPLIIPTSFIRVRGLRRRQRRRLAHLTATISGAKGSCLVRTTSSRP